MALRFVARSPIDRIASKRTNVDGKRAAKIVPGGCPRLSEPSKIEPERLENHPRALLGDRGRAGRVLGRAEDAPGTLPRRSGDALGEPRAPQERPGTLRERARDAPETLRRRPGTRSRRRTALKTSADRFSSVCRVPRAWAEVRFDMVFTIRNADRALCATDTSERRRRTKNEPFRPPKTTPGTSREPPGTAKTSGKTQSERTRLVERILFSQSSEQRRTRERNAGPARSARGREPRVHVWEPT